MDFTPLIEEVRTHVERGNQLMEPHRVVAAMGSRLALSLLVSAIRPGHQLVGAATCEPVALKLLKAKEADLLLCTDRLEQGNGGSLVAAAKRQDPALSAVMVVTQPRRLITIRRAVEAGCDGVCLESQIGRGTVALALTTVSAGAAYTEKGLYKQYFEGYSGIGDAPLAQLTDREVEVLQRIAADATNQEIAAALFISAETVKSHVAQIFHKLGARSRLHAAVKGIRLGLVEWPEDR
ncbi:response regulator transcription factor [Synechococcus sp. HK05]|uniref:response regulator transcription factor n=1 Tax=Synechococcus sp. HK05 TaxID=2725975 RepID=UPI001C386EC8|nr:response regulator transcription factor [Synechococcus sp. HK05]MBV2350218.1 response regulator transcription factor [Synechococcus sp. HK05]